MSHSGVVMSIFCTSKEVTSYICPPPSVLRVGSGGIGSQMEVTGIVLLQIKQLGFLPWYLYVPYL